MKFRALIWADAAHQGDLNLTGPEHSQLPDDELRAEGIAEMNRQGLTLDEGDHLYIALWNDPITERDMEKEN